LFTLSESTNSIISVWILPVLTLNSKTWAAISIILLTLGAAWIWISKPPAGSTTQGNIPAPHQGFQAPDFHLSTFSGEAYSLSDLRGKPVLVNFWASWYPPCRTEMPAMQNVYDEFQDEGFTVLAINTTYQDNLGDAITFAQVHQLTFPLLTDKDGTVANLYEVHSLPTSFFIDAQGMIQEVIVGGPMSDALLKIRVEQLLEINP
jgi:peroxiredoxin